VLVVVAFFLLLFGTCGYAIARGGRPEQLAGCALLLAATTTLLINLPRTVYFRNLETEVLLVDAALLAALVALALRANRYWPIWVTAMHAGTLAVHLAKFANPSLDWPLYSFAASVSSIPIQLILLWATIRHRRRLRQFGMDPPWNESSPRSIR
jgi:hypothetical protein